jgi:hypothetical protein
MRQFEDGRSVWLISSAGRIADADIAVPPEGGQRKVRREEHVAGLTLSSQ